LLFSKAIKSCFAYGVHKVLLMVFTSVLLRKTAVSVGPKVGTLTLYDYFVGTACLLAPVVEDTAKFDLSENVTTHWAIKSGSTCSIQLQIFFSCHLKF